MTSSLGLSDFFIILQIKGLKPLGVRVKNCKAESSVLSMLVCYDGSRGYVHIVNLKRQLHTVNVSTK